MTRWWWRLSQWATRLGGSLFWDLRVSGLENIPREGGCLLAANHQSYLDPPFVASVLPREMHFMARRSLFRNPVFRALIVRYNAFAIERDRAHRKGPTFDDACQIPTPVQKATWGEIKGVYR